MQCLLVQYPLYSRSVNWRCQLLRGCPSYASNGEIILSSKKKKVSSPAYKSIHTFIIILQCSHKYYGLVSTKYTLVNRQQMQPSHIYSALQLADCKTTSTDGHLYRLVPQPTGDNVNNWAFLLPVHVAVIVSTTKTGNSERNQAVIWSISWSSFRANVW